MKRTTSVIRGYVLGFCTTEADILDDKKNRKYFHCGAVDYDDAVRQLLEAEPTTNFHELIEDYTAI